MYDFVNEPLDNISRFYKSFWTGKGKRSWMGTSYNSHLSWKFILWMQAGDNVWFTFCLTFVFPEESKVSGGSKGGALSFSVQFFFHFHAVFGKILPIYRLTSPGMVPPPHGKYWIRHWKSVLNLNHSKKKKKPVDSTWQTFADNLFPGPYIFFFTFKTTHLLWEQDPENISELAELGLRSFCLRWSILIISHE